MIEMYVEGQPVDVNQGFSALLTFSIDDIKDFSKRNTSFSKTIVLPGTKRNNYLFGNIFEISASNFYNPAKPNYGYNYNASVGAKAYIFNDNIQIFKGILRLLQVTIDNDAIEYEVAVFGELGGFISALGNKKLEDLDFSSVDHIYNVSNIISSWDTPSAGSGYYYPLIDYGTYGSGGTNGKTNWDYRTLRPALFVKEYIDKIFSDSGYSYESAFFGTTRFKSLIIPNNQKLLQMQTTRFVYGSKYISDNVIDNVSGTPVSLSFGSAIPTGNFTSTNTNSRFTYIAASTVTFNINWNIFGDYVSNNKSFTLTIKKNGTTNVSGTQLSIAAINDVVQYSYNWTGSVSITLSQNDYLDFVYEVSSTSAQTYINTTDAVFEFVSDIPIVTPAAINNDLKMNELLPKNILQKDFFSWIIKLFNLYVYEDPNKEKVLKIEPYIDFYSGTVVDWSDKLDRSKPIVVKPLTELNSRYYKFIYKDDADYYNDQYKKRYNLSYGGYIYDSAYEFASDENVCQIGFSPTPLVGYLNDDKVYSTIFKRSGTTEETIDSNIRILHAKKITSITSWDIKDGSSVLSGGGSLTKYGYAGHLDHPTNPTNDLNFGTPNELFYSLSSGSLSSNQFNVYWSSYMAEITDKDSKMVTVNMKLDYKDIYEIDFSKFVMIDGSLFRVNKIEDYNATDKETCKVQLLKVIEKEY